MLHILLHVADITPAAALTALAVPRAGAPHEGHGHGVLGVRCGRGSGPDRRGMPGVHGMAGLGLLEAGHPLMLLPLGLLAVGAPG